MNVQPRDKRQKRRVASDEAHTWARNLRLGNPHAKSVLRAIAVYCNDEGRCIVGMPTLALDCDVSVDTVRSRLRFLEEVGAIVLFPCWRDSLGRRNYEKNGKRTTDDILLLIDADTDEIEARARGEMPSDDATEEHHAETGSDEFSPGHQQGLNPDDANRSHGLALGQPLDSANHQDSSEPEPDTSPQPPSGGRSVDASLEGKQAELLAYFRAHYPDRELWAWEKAAPIFAAMPASDQERAAASSPDYAKKIVLTRRKPPPVKPERFLKDRLFDNFPDSKLIEKPKAEQPRVFYPVDSDVFRAFKVANALAGRQLRLEWADGNLAQGIHWRGEIDPALLALAPLADVDFEAFAHVAIEGSNEWGAWKSRLRCWIGFEPEAVKVWTEPNDPAVHDLPFSHPDHKFRKHVRGIRVPWPFPPLKDGTISK